MGTVETDWWRRWPGIYQSEQDAFSQFGAKVTEVRAKNGQLVLAVQWPLAEDKHLDLVVEYSPHHPHCRPRVSSEQLRTDFIRHVDPFTGSLCLITQDGDQWDSNQSVAALINEQLQKIYVANQLHSGGDVASASKVEEHAPDPLSAYYDHTCEPMSVLYFDGGAKSVNGPFGFNTFSIRDRPTRTTKDQFEGYLDRVDSPTSQRLARLRDKWRPSGQWQKVSGPWVRLDVPRQATADELFAMAQKELRRHSVLQPALLARLEQMWRQPFSITSILFQDELNYGSNRFGDAWFCIVSRQSDRGQIKRTLVRTHRLDDDILARAPSAKPFAGKRIVVLGAGAIGSFVTIELARAGAEEVVIADSDIVEPGNSVRWPLGQASWGMPKPTALAAHIQQNFPRTTVSSEGRKIGMSYLGQDGKHINGLKHDLEMVKNADLVIDTTASVEVASALSSLCKDVGTDYLMAYATMGAAGGLIFEQPATGPACYVCLRENWTSGTLAGPPVDETGMIVPVGCNAPTFTGASFDLQEVSMSAMRSAASMLKEQGLERRQTRLANLEFAKFQDRRFPEWSLDEVAARCSRCNPKTR